MEHQFARKTKPAASVNAGWRTARTADKTQGAPSTVPSSVRDVLRSSGQPLDPATRAFMEPRLGHDFSEVPTFSSRRGPASAPEVELFSQRFGGGSEDPVHQPLLDRFRSEQGQPSGGVDAQGNQVGPSDAEIKYRTQPISVSNGPFHAAINTPKEVGMEIAITVHSSSGNDADMALVQDSEQVSASSAHEGCFAAQPLLLPQTTGFMPAVNIPNDEHTIGPRAVLVSLADNHGGSGSFVLRQLDIYTDARHGIFNPIAIPSSGYKIKHSITAGPGTQLVVTTEKSPEACTVNGYSTTAGPSPAQSDPVTIRP